MIPFPSIATGGSPILVYGDRALIDELFGVGNWVFGVDGEAELDAFLCAQAVLSPAVSLVNEAAGWLGMRVADADMAEAFLRTLVGSSLLGSRCAPLLSALDTAGGYNQLLRRHMLDTGLGERLKEGLDRLARS